MGRTSKKDRISEMIEVIMNVARGDYSTHIEISDKSDELDSLAMGINMMIDDIKDSIEKDKKRVGESEKAYQKLQATQEASLNIMEDLDRQRKELSTLNKHLQLEIAERKKVEQALKESEEWLKILFEYAPDAYYINDLKGTFVDGNKAAEEITGYMKKELIGKSFLRLKLLSPKQIAKASTLLAKNVLGKATGPDEFILNRKDGIQISAEIRTFPVKIKDKTLVLGIARDITERKKAEEKLQKILLELKRSNEELEQFAYVTSHDLQEPLRMVASYTQLLEKRYKDKLDADAKDFIQYANDGARRMQKLISALLLYSRVGTQGREFEPTNCKIILNKALNNLEVMIDESDATVTFDSLPTVVADDVQMIQLFQNLISNAIKFRNKEPPKIHVSANKEDKEWIFSVRDNGIGINPKDKERIFTIFQRLHSREEYPGVGIGLTICKRIVERHFGKIWVESKPGKGSTFYFTIPIRGEEKRETKDEGK